MDKTRTALAALGVAAALIGQGLGSAAVAEPADETAAAPSEVAMVAREIAAVLASLQDGAPEAEITAAMDRYFQGSPHSNEVRCGALARTLQGAVSEAEGAALGRLYARYASRVGEAQEQELAAREAPPAPPRAVAPAAAPAAREELIAASASAGPSGPLFAPPPLPPAGGGSDYRP